MPSVQFPCALVNVQNGKQVKQDVFDCLLRLRLTLHFLAFASLQFVAKHERCPLCSAAVTADELIKIDFEAIVVRTGEDETDVDDFVN